MRKREIGHEWVMGAISLVLQAVRSRRCFRWRNLASGWFDLASGWVRSRQCWGAMRPVRSRVRCGGAIWVVCAISPALLSLHDLGFGFFFFFLKWFEGKLGDGFWTVGRHNLGWLELG